MRLRTLSFVTAGLLGGGGCGDKPPAAVGPARPAVRVTTEAVQAREVERGVSVVGTLEGTEELFLAPKVDGRVLHVLADVGDTVLPGAPLLELDPTDLRLEVEAARRSLEAELARLGLTALPGEDFRPEAVPAVARAQAALSNARAERDRLRALANTVSMRERDTAEYAFREAEASYRDALTQIQATVASARLRQANLGSAEQRLNDATLFAPVPAGHPAWAALLGVVGSPLRYAVAERLVSEGEMIRANPVTNAFRLVLDYALKLQAAVPEQYGANVHVGQAVTLKVDAHPERTFRGRITRINPTVNRATRTFRAEVSVPNLDSGLKAGGFARGRIETARESGVLTVPPQAVVTFAGVTKLFVVENDAARAVEVELGERQRDWVEVKAPGLKPGDRVATSGFSQLVDGSAVAER